MSLETERRTREQGAASPPEIIAQLERILGSAPFRTSKRCSDLLKHVVEAACEGRLEHLKERTLGVAVFDRDPDYDSNQDPVVRTTAGQVRKRLAQYYLEPGHGEELRIDLPAGAYVPLFHTPPVREPVHAPEPALLAPVDTAARTPRLSRSAILIGASGLALLIAVAALLLFRHPENDVDRYWAPLLKQSQPVVLCVGQGHVYKLKGDLDRLFDPDAGTSEIPPPAPQNIPLNSVYSISDRIIGIHDAQTLVRLTALFAGRGKSVELRGGRSTTLGDLRGKPVVLIGAFNNSWTLSLTGELRFYFDEDPAGKGLLVRDRQHPEARAWEVQFSQEAALDHEDYAIVSRVLDPTTEQPVIVAAGIQGGGTAAAGEFLTSVGYLSKALENAPAHWETRNVQFVLKTRLLSGAAGPPEVVASYYW